jgi:dephospho-CoA kinase
MSKVIKIGLTGNEGSGLHNVGAQFEKIGVSVFNADVEIKWLLNYDESVIGLIKRNLGSSSIVSGFINSLAIDSDSKFDKLIDIIEFKLFDSFNKFVNKNSDRCYVIFLSSLIFERNWSTRFDMNIMVNKQYEERVLDFWRVNKYDYQFVEEMFENEISQSHKSSNSELIIDNTSESNMKKSVSKCDDSIIDYYFKTEKELKSQILNNIYGY